MDTQEMSLSFSNKEEDIKRLTTWMFEMIQPYIKGRALEIGSGQGAISSVFIEHDLPIHLSDEKEVNREELRGRFSGVTSMKMIHDIDFHSGDFVHTYTQLAGVFDTVIAINITEHGFYDQIVLNNAKFLLRRRGHFAAITPSRAVLFNGMGQDLSGLKEYNFKIAKNLMGVNFEILKVRCFNWAGALKSPGFSEFDLSTLAIYRKIM